jgi:hypothetical protein
MDSIVVRGGRALNGQIPIAGAKNACLALMPATLLSEEPLTLTNAPRLSDIKTMTLLLQSLGAEVTAMQSGKVLAMTSHGLNGNRADYDIVRKMRASNLVLGPLARAARAGGGVAPGRLRHRGAPDGHPHRRADPDGRRDRPARRLPPRDHDRRPEGRRGPPALCLSRAPPRTS